MDGVSSTFLDAIDLGLPTRRAAAHMLKMRARHFARRPAALDTLYPGLSAAAPDRVVAIARHLVAREGRSPRRWFGFGGEVTLIMPAPPFCSAARCGARRGRENMGLKTRYPAHYLSRRNQIWRGSFCGLIP